MMSIKLANLTILGAYRPFKIQGNEIEYLEKMKKFITENKSEQMMIIGDLNFDYLKIQKGDSNITRAF